MAIPQQLQSQALPAIDSIGFIDYILRNHSKPTTLIVCLTREAFLSDLQACIQRTHPHKDSTNANQEEPHPLLIPTIHLIATSRTVNLVFTPTLPHLRAYLSVYQIPSKATMQAEPCAQVPLLAIWNLASLHRSTVEHSAQGLSRTLASAVEAAYSAGQRLVLADSPIMEMVDLGGEVHEAQSDPWQEQVPLLSGSARVAGGGRVLAGRTVEVGRVLGRWCWFVSVEEIGGGV